MSLFYSYIAGSLNVSGPQAHLQESSYSCSHNHWFSVCTALDACSAQHTEHASRADRYWTNGCVNSCTNSPEDGPVGPKHVEIQQHRNKIVTSVGFHSIRWKDARYKKLNPLKPELNPICYLLALLAHHFLHVSRIRVKSLTIRLLMSYIYGAPILDVSRSLCVL